jgi:hypothetical protein
MVSMTVRIVDTVPGGGAEAYQWEAPAAKLTLREFLAGRIRSEVAAFNRDCPEVYQGLVAPEESERVLNGYRLKRRRQLDPQRQIDRALRAFEANGFMVFANGRQIDSLEAEVDFSTAPELEFVKLVPLVGG